MILELNCKWDLRRKRQWFSHKVVQLGAELKQKLPTLKQETDSGAESQIGPEAQAAMA